MRRSIVSKMATRSYSPSSRHPPSGQPLQRLARSPAYNYVKTRPQLNSPGRGMCTGHGHLDDDPEPRGNALQVGPDRRVGLEQGMPGRNLSDEHADERRTQVGNSKGNRCIAGRTALRTDQRPPSYEISKRFVGVVNFRA